MSIEEVIFEVFLSPIVMLIYDCAKMIPGFVVTNDLVHKSPLSMYSSSISIVKFTTYSSGWFTFTLRVESSQLGLYRQYLLSDKRLLFEEDLIMIFEGPE